MIMLQKDAFNFLGLSEKSTLDDVKKRYKKLALKYHPDKGGTASDFQKLNTACEIVIKTLTEVAPNDDKVSEMGTDWALDLMKAWFGDFHRAKEEKRRRHECRAEKIRQEKKEKGYATLSHEQKQVLKQLANELERYLQENHEHPLGEQYRYTHEKQDKPGIFSPYDEDNLYYDYSTNIAELNELISPLVGHINQYIIDCDLPRFKEKCDTTFLEVTYDKYKPFLVEVYDAIVFVFRVFFRLFDHLITFATQSKQLMADTSTPFAQTFLERPHFFEYSTQEAKKNSKRRQKLTDEFHAAIEQLEKLLPWPQRKQGENFSVVMSYLDGEARIAFLNAMKKHLPTGYQIQNEDFWKYLTDAQYTDVCIEMKEYWPKIIKTAKQFADMLHFMNKEQRTAVYHAKKDAWHALINTSEDFKIFEYLNEEQRTALYDVKQAGWSELIETGYDFGWLLRNLNEDQRTAIFLVKQAGWSEIIKTGADLGSVLAYLNEEQRTIIYNMKRTAWAEIIANGVDFFHVMRGLNAVQRESIYQVIHDDGFKIIKSGVDFNFVFESLKRAGLDTDVLLNIMKRTEQKFIKHRKDIVDALYNLDEAECEKFFDVMSDELSQFIVTKKDVNAILDSVYYGDRHKEIISRLLYEHFPQAFEQSPSPF